MNATERSQSSNDKAVTLILLVEDDDAVADVIVQALLGETPYQVTRVSDGFQALKLLRTIKPQLFLFDYNLPSYEWNRTLRSASCAREVCPCPDDLSQRRDAFGDRRATQSSFGEETV